jgi:hypothetical protein
MTLPTRLHQIDGAATPHHGTVTVACHAPETMAHIMRELLGRPRAGATFLHFLGHRLPDYSYGERQGHDEIAGESKGSRSQSAP